jgi:hypothetical protein
MKEKAFQDYYEEDVSHCYGCGVLTKKVCRLKATGRGRNRSPGLCRDHIILRLPFCIWRVDRVSCRLPRNGNGGSGNVSFGGEGYGYEPKLRFVTASLKVDYLLPTPIGVELVAHGKVKSIGKRKVVVSIEVSAAGKVCAREKSSP